VSGGGGGGGGVVRRCSLGPLQCRLPAARRQQQGAGAYRRLPCPPPLLAAGETMDKAKEMTGLAGDKSANAAAGTIHEARRT
jgi:hypothetical protein